MSQKTQPAPKSQLLAGSGATAWRRLWDQTGILLVFVVLCAGCSIFVPNFLSMVNIKGLLLSVATVGIIACTMLFCLASGDFDLSVGSVVAMSGVLAAVVTNWTGSVLLGILAGAAAGALVGLANGIVIAVCGINALITTLATMQIVRGLSYLASDGKAIGVANDGFYVLGNSAPRMIPWLGWLDSLGMAGTWLLDMPTPVWIMLACFVVFGTLLKKTVFGRNTLAIGGNREAALLAGIPVVRTKIVIFSLQGMAAGFAGMILASRMTSGQPAAAQGLELQVISACVLGGVSLTGGIGTMTGVIMGVMIMGIVQNAMSLLNLPPFWQYVASGAILLAAVLLDRLKQRRGILGASAVQLASRAQRYGQCVGHVGRLGQFAQAAGRLDRPLHLKLRGVPVARQVLLDRRRGQAADSYPRLLGRQHNHPPRVGHQDARPRVLVVGVKLLDGHHVRLQLANHRRQVGVNLSDPLGQLRLRAGPQRARLDDNRTAAAGHVHGRVPGNVQPGVDAQYAKCLSRRRHTGNR